MPFKKFFFLQYLIPPKVESMQSFFYDRLLTMLESRISHGIRYIANDICILCVQGTLQFSICYEYLRKLLYHV